MEMKRGPGRPRKSDEPRRLEKVYGQLPAEMAQMVRRLAEVERRSMSLMVTILIEEALIARSAKETEA